MWKTIINLTEKNCELNQQKINISSFYIIPIWLNKTKKILFSFRVAAYRKMIEINMFMFPMFNSIYSISIMSI